MALDTPMTFLDGAGNENFIAMRSHDGKLSDEGDEAAKDGQICQDITTENKGSLPQSSVFEFQNTIWDARTQRVH